MKKIAFRLALFLSLVGTLSAQESLASMRRQLYENGSTPKDRAQLWELFKGRIYPLTEDILEARLENNLNVLGISMILLLDRAVIWMVTDYHVEIAELTEKHFNFTKEYLKTHKSTPASFRLAYARLMTLITPIINRIDRSFVPFNLKGYFNQYSEIEHLKDLAFDLLKEDEGNPDHWMLLAEYRVLTSNRHTMTHAALAERYLKKVIKEYERLARKEDLAWAYLWQSSLYMRRCLNKKAMKSIEEARALFPKSFLVEEALGRLGNGLSWI